MAFQVTIEDKNEKPIEGLYVTFSAKFGGLYPLTEVFPGCYQYSGESEAFGSVIINGRKPIPDVPSGKVLNI